MLRTIVAAMAIGVVATPASPARAQSLKGSPHSLTVQNREARAEDFTYLSSRSQIHSFVKRGLLVRLPGNADYMLHAVSYPYARPAVKTFVERIARQYRAACGEQLVVTSLVRPESMHLWNSSSRTVHPTGMAMDLRRSTSGACVRWMRETLLSLEAAGVLEATQEHHPAHFHVALFPQPYRRYLVALGEDAGSRGTAVAVADAAAPAGDARTLVSADAPSTAGDGVASADEAETAAYEDGQALEADLVPHVVIRGETLWDIARRFGTTVAALLDANALDSSRIVAGQTLKVPAPPASVATAVATEASRAEAARVLRYRVDDGDSLWSIARQHDTTVGAIKRVNNLSSSRIRPGQILRVPLTGS